MLLLRIYRQPGLAPGLIARIQNVVSTDTDIALGTVESEYCYYVESTVKLPQDQLVILKGLLAETYAPDGIKYRSQLADSPTIFEVGPRMAFETPESSNTVAILRDCGITTVSRVERSSRLAVTCKLRPAERTGVLEALFERMVFDRMTQMVYEEPLRSFTSDVVPEPVRIIPLLRNGMSALEDQCKKAGLPFDQQDLEFLYQLFCKEERRNPTDVELFTLGQLLSEHCAHGYWKGIRRLNGRSLPKSLMDRARASYEANPGSALVAFDDEASVLRASRSVKVLIPSRPGTPSPLVVKRRAKQPAITGETHNHPTKNSPYPGAATGKARIRDEMSLGRGGVPATAANGIIVGNLRISGHLQPWEEPDSWQPIGAVAPLEIALQARDGAFAFGNADGEPEIGGFFYAIGIPFGGEFRSYFKPVFFTVGYGAGYRELLKKHNPEPGDLLVQIGGPAYAIGLGGGSRSSTTADLGDDLTQTAGFDFDSVQRGCPFMQRLGVEFFRTCTDLGRMNPIRTTKDLGAGGHCTADLEITEGAGLLVDYRAIPSGDQTMSTLVGFCDEAQERSIIVARARDLERITDYARREGCPLAVIGEFVPGSRFVLYDRYDRTTPVDLPLDRIFAKRPRKTFDLDLVPVKLKPLIRKGISFDEALSRVLRLPGVAAKSWLVNRVDGSVGGLSAQQQRTGPTHFPLADYQLTALSFLDTVGSASAIGVRPLIGLVKPEAMGRMIVAEAVLGLCGVVTEGLRRTIDIVNWMSDVKSPGEGMIVERVERALSAAEITLGIARTGGKDSSSMANLAHNPAGEVKRIKSPVTTVVTLKSSVPDIRKKITPVIRPGDCLLHVDLSPNAKRLGGSAFAQTLNQLGSDCPDVNLNRLQSCFEVMQGLVASGQVTATHDISDGGLIVAALEMAFVSGCGLEIETISRFDAIEYYLAEEPGLVIACLEQHIPVVVAAFQARKLRAYQLGRAQERSWVTVWHNGTAVIDQAMPRLRDQWLDTSLVLDSQEANPVCIGQERQLYRDHSKAAPLARLTFNPNRRWPKRSRIALRALVPKAPGSNGEQELAGILHVAGFEPTIATLYDLTHGDIALDDFQLLAHPGGFSYQDVLGAGRGWAAVVERNDKLRDQYRRFFTEREDTVSYSVCNGMQMVTALGLVPFADLTASKRPRMLQNLSEQFESRIIWVRIEDSPAVMFADMAGSILPIWVAHGEGRLHCPDQRIYRQLVRDNLVPLKYVGLDGEPSEDYPLNPNGSPAGIAGLCTPDGRHVALMPHIERLFQLWQFPYLPEEWRDVRVSPWLYPFHNLHQWCLEHR